MKMSQEKVEFLPITVVFENEEEYKAHLQILQKAEEACEENDWMSTASKLRIYRLNLANARKI